MPRELYFLNNSKTSNSLKQKNWEEHPLGAPEKWPQELKTVLSLIQNSKQPMVIFWSNKAYCFYNDSYFNFIQKKVDINSIGEKASIAWKNIWPTIESKVNKVLSGGEATWNQDQNIPLARNGEVEDRYWTYSYNPIKGADGKTNGVLSTSQETTEQVVQRQRLETSEAKLRGILEGSTDYVVALDLEGYFMVFNSALAEECLRVYGRAPQVGDHVSTVFGETHSQSELFDISWERAIKGECFTTEDSYEFDGEKRFFQITYSPIRGEDGVLIGTTKSARDITAYKKNENALRESESSFRALSETMPQIVWTADSSGHLKYVNKKGEDFTGRPIEECLGGDILESIHKMDRNRLLSGWGKALKTKKPFTTECRLRNKSGSYKWFLFRALPYLSSNEEADFRWVGTCTNIHNHKILLEKLSKSEERLNLALESGKIGLWDWNNQTDKVYMSHTCLQAWELKKSKLPLTLVNCMNLIHEYDQGAVWEAFFLSAHTGKTYDVDYRLKCDSDQLPTWINGKGRCFQDSNGRLSKITGVVLDITKKKQATLEIQKAKAEAESANRLKSSFLANMSHEIRTPLGVIAGFTDLLRSDELKKSEKKYYSDIVGRTTNQLSTIIDDILDLSKVEAGQLKTECQDVHMERLIDEVVAALKVKANEKNIILKTELSDIAGMRIGTDPTRVSQILYNLIGNSIKFTSKGSISLEATYRAGDLRIYIADTGIGIKPEQREMLFKPFSQVDATITRKFGGTGLGLTLSKKLANALGGDLILLSSTPDKGSVFCVQLKDQGSSILRHQVPKESKKSIKTTKARISKQIFGKRILVIEDAKENQVLFNKYLTDKGMVVEIAENGELGYEKAMSGEFDCVLMDIQMPILDGYSATKKLRSHGYKKPIIALTAHAMSEAKDQCLSSGCDDYITKPLNVDDLYGKIQTLTAS